MRNIVVIKDGNFMQIYNPKGEKIEPNVSIKLKDNAETPGVIFAEVEIVANLVKNVNDEFVAVNDECHFFCLDDSMLYTKDKKEIAKFLVCKAEYQKDSLSVVTFTCIVDVVMTVDEMQTRIHNLA